MASVTAQIQAATRTISVPRARLAPRWARVREFSSTHVFLLPIVVVFVVIAACAAYFVFRTLA